MTGRPPHRSFATAEAAAVAGRPVPSVAGLRDASTACMDRSRTRQAAQARSARCANRPSAQPGSL
jgi:hypothetical protein